MPTATTYYQTNLTTNITYLKGVGPQRGGALKRYGIENVGQLLHHFPRRYLDRTNIKNIREVKIGEEAVIIGKIASFGMQQARRRRFFQMTLNDPTGYLTCVWFNSISWIVDKFQEGDSIAVFGKIEFRKGFQITLWSSEGHGRGSVGATVATQTPNPAEPPGTPCRANALVLDSKAESSHSAEQS